MFLQFVPLHSKNAPRDILAKLESLSIAPQEVMYQVKVRNINKDALKDLVANPPAGYKIKISSSKSDAKCPDGKVFNPNTSRCINANGQAARKLGLVTGQKKPKAAVAKPKVVAQTRKTIAVPKTRKISPIKSASRTRSIACPYAALKGIHFVFAGFRDDLMVKQIRACGGEVEKDFTSYTKYLIYYDEETKAGRKCIEAGQRGIRRVSYKQFIEKTSLKTDTRVIRYT